MIDKKLAADLLRTIARDNCRDAFASLFDLYFDKLFDIARYYLKAPQLAEEAVSDVFVKIWRNRANLSGVSDPTAYLITAIKRQSLNYLRSEKKNLIYIDDLDFDVMLEPRSADGESLEEELMSVYAAAIKQLPDKCRIVYVMAKEEDLKYREIADILNISQKTVESQMHTALDRIRKSLEQYLGRRKRAHSNNQ